MTNDRHYTDLPIEQKVAMEREEGLVVFHIGLRLNAFWKVNRWLPILLLAPRMIRNSSLIRNRACLKVER